MTWGSMRWLVKLIGVPKTWKDTRRGKFWVWRKKIKFFVWTVLNQKSDLKSLVFSLYYSVEKSTIWRKQTCFSFHLFLYSPNRDDECWRKIKHIFSWISFLPFLSYESSNNDWNSILVSFQIVLKKITKIGKEFLKDLEEVKKRIFWKVDRL